MSKSRFFSLLLTAFLVFVCTCFGVARDTKNYYALHVNNTGYFKQVQGAVANDKDFRYTNAYDGNGSSIWVFDSQDDVGYLQCEMYYLNVANGQTLYLSTTPDTQWDLIADGTKNRFQLHGTTKILGLDGSNKPVLAVSPSKKYTACSLSITEHSWKDLSGTEYTVQSPQLVTFLRSYYTRNITVTIDKNDAGSSNVKVVDKKDAYCYVRLTFKPQTGGYSGQGSNWQFDETKGVIYNLKDSNQTASATYTITPLDPLVSLPGNLTTEKTIKLTINPKAFDPDNTHSYLIFNTQSDNYRFLKATSSMDDVPVLVNGKKSDLTEAVNPEIGWEVSCDAEGYYFFKNKATNRYLCYDSRDYSYGDLGVAVIKDLPLEEDNRFKFRIFSKVSRDPYGECYYIIPYEKQFAIFNNSSTGAIEQLKFALNVDETNKVAGLTTASDRAKWKVYEYVWENRLWDNYAISGPQDVYDVTAKKYTASTWRSRNIKDSPKNNEVCQLGNKTHNNITYAWVFTGLDGYITSSSESLGSNGVSTLTTVFALPVSIAGGSLKVTATVTSVEVGTVPNPNNKSMMITLHNLNPTLTEIGSLSAIQSETGAYKLTGNNTYSSTNKPQVATFKGVLDGGGYTITGLTEPLFTTLTDANVYNLNFDEVSIPSSKASTNVGTVCGEATGNTRIYNVGVLGGSISGSGNVGGLVGRLSDYSRVINCFSRANITGGATVGGIVGKNEEATTATNLKTMVMNCMFYGDITYGTGISVAPIYNGTKITNVGENTGVGNYNYFWSGAQYVEDKKISVYNCALSAETRYLERFEFFRHLLNSHRELAGWWVTGSYDNKDKMLKWVFDPNQIGSDFPFPVLKTPGKYPSVVNIDAENAQENQPRNKGGKLGTLTVNIQMGNGAVFNHPGTGDNEAKITTSQLTLNITDKDPDHFNFNYYKVQLPYYNDVGSKNYTGNRVVTGWKIVGITGGGSTSYSTGSDVTYNAQGDVTATPYNFADRNCTGKDLYGTSGRVFSQGAYWDVPEGVTAITIEPYWAKAAYLSDAYPDVVYNVDMTTPYNVPNVGGGQKYINDRNYDIAGEDQKVYTSMSNAVTALSPNASNSVNDYAVVLVGNYHQYFSKDAAIGGNNKYTVTTIDLDHDNEPDYSFMFRDDGRNVIHPLKWDFLTLVGLGMAQKSTGGKGTYNLGIMIPKGWFESTNTSLFRVTQFEYEHGDRPATDPLILHGGVMEQWVSSNQKGISNKIPYIHVGSNVWFKEFHTGCHQDRQYATKHSPISVTGGDFDEFYLTGLYRGDITNYEDNAECYINGGRFGIVAGAAMEGVGKAGGADDTGNIFWQIQNADMDEFYGGGLNAARPVEGNITNIVTGGYIKFFCAGPKFGDMNDDKKVKTTANNVMFDTYFGAGYGGNSYSRYAPSNINNINGDYGTSNWNKWLNEQYKQGYSTTYKGVSVTYNTQYIPMSNNYQNVARLLIDFVSFSLAKTRNVTSNLTGCTINENFYGGGSLGKVEGPVNSTLENCIVKGNVFGAGYSATVPKVEVRNKGNFVKAPFYDDNLGVYFDPEFPPSVKYTWEYAATVNATNAINTTDHKLRTTINVDDKNNLGSVLGNVTLILKGSTKVGTLDGGGALVDGTGNVFGGGDESVVTNKNEQGQTVANIGNTSVKLQGQAEVYGNVFGGGNEGNVAGNAEVKIQD